MAYDVAEGKRSPALRGFLGIDEGREPLAELEPVFGKFEKRSYSAGESIIREGDPADALYVIDAGEVEAIKDSEGAKVIGRMSAGAVFGELALFTGKPRAATIRAKSDVSAFRLMKSDFEELSRGHPQIGGALLNTLYSRLGTSYRELEESEEGLRKANRMRTELASVFTNVVLVITIYSFVLAIAFSGAIPFLSFLTERKFIVSRLVEVMALFVIARMVKNSGQALRSFGLTLVDWKKTSLESLAISLAVMAFLALCKWAVLRLIPGLFPDNSLVSSRYLDWSYLSYLLVAPLQEFIARCAMQGSLQRLLVGKRSAFWAILVTSFLFGSLHLYESVGLSVMALVTSWLWGWMYARRGSLLGVSISHFLIGNWAGLLGLWAIM